MFLKINQNIQPCQQATEEKNTWLDQFIQKKFDKIHVIYDKTFSKLGMKENHFNPLNYIPSKYRANIIFNGERDS